MRFAVSFLILIAFSSSTDAQNYRARLKKYRTEYITRHEVVPDSSRNYLRFFPVKKTYRVIASFEKINGSTWFNLPTSSGRTKAYRKYGRIQFKIRGKVQELFLYQAQALLENPVHWDLLFLPFTDASSGVDSYAGGRYLDLKIADIKNQKVEIDFNKAYNPYCAYVEGKYSCPIPPKENQLAVAIRAGEKDFDRLHANK